MSDQPACFECGRLLQNLVSARPWPSAASPQASPALRMQRRRTNRGRGPARTRRVPARADRAGTPMREDKENWHAHLAQAAGVVPKIFGMASPEAGNPENFPDCQAVRRSETYC